MQTGFIVAFSLATSLGASDKSKVANIIPFDVSTCAPLKAALPSAANDVLIVGALGLVRPAITECFIQPGSRTKADIVEMTIKTTVDATGAKHELTGTNMSDAGKACALAAIESLPWKDMKATKAETGTFQIRVGNQTPMIAFGINDMSDYVGNLRANTKGLCACIDATKPTPLAKFDITLAKGAVTNVAFVDAIGLTDTQKECLKTQLTSTKVGEKAGANFKFTLPLVNSTAQSPTTGADVVLQFQQIDVIRARLNAEYLLAFGKQMSALAAYNAAVPEYKKATGKKQLAALQELKTKCGQIVEADQGLEKSSSAVLSIDKQALTLTDGLAATDKQWTEAKVLATEQVTKSETSVKQSQSDVKAHQSLCAPFKGK